MKQKTTRRDFLRAAGAAGAGALLGFHVLPAGALAEKLQIGIIGAGGKGEENIRGVRGEEIAAICDVDEGRAAWALKEFPRARRYRDYRRLLEEEKDIQAVVVSTPDHVHAPASVMAMNLGKHVYCEKPLTHSIHEARVMKETAARRKVATQMGIQGHAEDDQRWMVERVQSGAIGAVRAVHVWTDRPIWPQGIDRPRETPPVPASLDWDLWLGPAPARPYHPDYVPFKWRGWWDFGTGALGDMACHNADMAFWALKLGYPTAVEVESSPVNAETAPRWSVIRYQFPARGELPPVTLTWHDGMKLPPADLFEGEKIEPNGSLVVGEKGKLYVPHYWGKGKLLPAAQYRDYQEPERRIPRSPGHYQEWLRACKGGEPALASFEYAAVQTEALLLGNLALRTGKKIVWNAEAMKAEGCPEADAFIRREYRKGHGL